MACWNSAKRMLDEVAEPVMNVPSTPMNGPISGQAGPAAAAACASTSVMPAWTRMRDRLSIAARATSTGTRRRPAHRRAKLGAAPALKRPA